MTNMSWRRVFRYSGLVSLSLGILATLWVLFFIWLNQLLCNEGNSPILSRGCGYVPQEMLFGEAITGWPTLLFGLYLIYLGGAILVLGWLCRDAPWRALP